MTSEPLHLTDANKFLAGLQKRLAVLICLATAATSFLAILVQLENPAATFYWIDFVRPFYIYLLYMCFKIFCLIKCSRLVSCIS